MTTTAPDQVVTLLAMLIAERTGLHYASRDRDLLLRKLSQHAEDQGFPTLLDYYWALRYDDPAGERTAALVDALVVGETYFFREVGGLEQVVAHVGARARAGRRARVWSAACATGEEPLSLAVLLAEAGILDQVDILATDLSAAHLARAIEGRHGRRALRNLPEGRPPWIRAVDGAARVDPHLRARVEWRRVNLVDEAAVDALGAFDAILCRNVLIYFDDETTRRVAARLAGALAPEGILVIGTSESLLRLGTVLECVERGGTFLYRRRA